MKDKFSPPFNVGDRVLVTCRGKSTEMQIKSVIEPGQWGSNERYTTSGLHYLCQNDQDMAVFAQECLQKAS